MRTHSQGQRDAEPARGRPPPRVRGELHLLLHQQGVRRHAEPPAARSGWLAAGAAPGTSVLDIDTTMSIDTSTHSLFGASKAAADLLVQEYGATSTCRPSRYAADASPAPTARGHHYTL